MRRRMYSVRAPAANSYRCKSRGGSPAPTTHYSPQSRFRGVRHFGYRSCSPATLTRSNTRSRPADPPPYRPRLPPPRRPSSHSTSRRHRTISDRNGCRIRPRPTFRHRSRPCRKQPTTLVRSNPRTPGYRAIICRRRNTPLCWRRWRRYRGLFVPPLRPTFQRRWHPCRKLHRANGSRWRRRTRFHRNWRR